ncbi:FAS1-like dehydratase domain-containing protein [Azorhizobium doebereinerae]|uniref:FAS1-like dehydratase domain-containing protein n=1 Tax=Azorhizobium doebereinerae TaxID=281091 RepID=UPI000407B579|nr:MaoC family dehydratase N-terminal domain-containing protein [Azorhizobium doebereinerae]
MSAAVPALDIDLLRSWIGRTEEVSDLVTARGLREMRVTLNQPAGDPAPGEAAMLTAHWCLAPPAVPMDGLGPDGHPARGGFLPPVPLPRRMWAGGQLEWHDDLKVGDVVARRSRIADVVVKDGRTGTLCFVTVAHEIVSPRGLAVRERQDIVYRGADAPAGGSGMGQAAPAAQWQESVDTSPVLLFRYSAITFNGHRIHYDRSYCVEEEGYPGLVVHGPLQATLLAEFAGRLFGRKPKSFAFRSVRPIFDGPPMTLNAVETADGLALWTADSDGQPCMKAEAA